MKISTSSKLVAGLKWSLYLLVAVISGVLLINLFDQSLHPDIPAFADFSRETVPAEQNAYFALMGQGVASQSDPHLQGMELVNYVNRIMDKGKHHDVRAMEIPDRLYGNGKIQLRGDINTLCERDAPRCLPAYRQKARRIAQMLRDNQVLITRTYRLYHYPHYRETIQETHVAPWPMYNALGSDLILAKIGLQAMRGEQLQALEALEQEVRFWRMVLRESRMLLTKMVAVTRLKRGFRLASEIMAAYPPTNAQAAVLMRILAPLGAGELDMARAFRSEFIFEQGMVESISVAAMADADTDTDKKLMWTFMELFLFKRNATINLIYARNRDLAALGTLPADEFLNRIQRQANAASRLSWPSWHFAYNPIGKILGEISIPDYIRYIGRIHNLDGLLRLVKLQLLMQQRGAGSMQDADFLVDPALINPYTRQPMGWDPTSRTLYFQGLREQQGGALLGQDIEVVITL